MRVNDLRIIIEKDTLYADNWNRSLFIYVSWYIILCDHDGGTRNSYRISLFKKIDLKEKIILQINADEIMENQRRNCS